MRRTLATVITAMATVLIALTGCSSDRAPERPASAGLVVGAGFYPITEIVERVGGPAVELIELTPPGAEAHDVELSAKDLVALQDAALVFILGSGFQPGVESQLASLGDGVTVDLLDGLDLRTSTDEPATTDTSPSTGTAAPDDHGHADGAHDPHVWLAPPNMAAMAERVAAELARLDPDGAFGYQERAGAYATEMSALDAELAAGLSSCRGRTLVTNHDAFGYLTARYGLEQLPISGLSPDDEPSAAELEDIAAAARRAGVATIFVEQGISADLSATLARELGIATAELHTIESITEAQADAGVGYATLQRDNLAALRQGLACG